MDDVNEQTFDIKSLLMHPLNKLINNENIILDKFLIRNSVLKDEEKINKQCSFFNKMCENMNQEEQLFFFEHISHWLNEQSFVLALPNCVPILVSTYYPMIDYCGDVVCIPSKDHNIFYHLFYVKRNKIFRYNLPYHADMKPNCFKNLITAIEVGQRQFKRDEKWFKRHGYNTKWTKGRII